LNIY